MKIDKWKIGSGIISFLLAAIAYLYPNWDFKLKAIAMLTLVILNLLLYLWQCLVTNDALDNGFAVTKQKHEALAVQFTEKQEAVAKYEQAVECIRAMVTLAAANHKRQKLVDLANCVNAVLQNINNGGTDRGQANQSGQDY